MPPALLTVCGRCCCRFLEGTTETESPLQKQLTDLETRLANLTAVLTTSAPATEPSPALDDAHIQEVTKPLLDASIADLMKTLVRPVFARLPVCAHALTRAPSHEQTQLIEQKLAQFDADRIGTCPPPPPPPAIFPEFGQSA